MNQQAATTDTASTDSTTQCTKNNRTVKRLDSVETLFAYERQLYQAGATTIVCIDEVGRGALAGPVSAAAVVLGADWQPVEGIADSKQLTAKKREELAHKLAESVQLWQVAHVDAAYIDQWGIMVALRRAMLLALEGLQLQGSPDQVLIDGLPMRLFDRETAIVKGDATIAGIAAASILAKVERDRLMCVADEQYGGYGFASNKGYGSAKHRAAIISEGFSPLHRRSFCQKILQSSNSFDL
ncbi:MAG: ribonuclease HII [Coriobacteriia bacterium]|nr:ribonuclease HII [Coriobacteriia bacterium]